MSEDGPVTVFQCPDCGLVMSRMHQVKQENCTSWRCWDCEHEFGIVMDRGSLDLGITLP